MSESKRHDFIDMLLRGLRSLCPYYQMMVPIDPSAEDALPSPKPKAQDGVDLLRPEQRSD